MDKEILRKAAVEFVLSIAKGNFTAVSLAKDYHAWTGASGDLAGDAYVAAVAVVSAVFPAGLKMTVEKTTAEDRRVTLLANSKGKLFTGDIYEQYYHFFVEFNEQGEICHTREYMNTKLVLEVLRPAMMRWVAEKGQ
jgi:ketosteroid isomerase-like protein